MKAGAPSRTRITESSARTTICARVADDEIGDRREAAARLVVVGDQRFAAEIGAGGDEREIVGRMAPRGEVGFAGERVHDQPLQRRIGEHQPDFGEAGRDARREDAATAREHDRPLARFEQRALRLADLGETRPRWRN